MKDIKNLGFGTKAIHANIEPDSATGALMTPIYQTSTYFQASPGDHKGFAYSRSSNPTRKVLEGNLAALEDGQYGLCFSSGMAAIDAALKLLKPGDELIASEDLYGGSYRLFTGIYKDFGIKFRFISMQNIEDLRAAINPSTKMIWIESPSNPLLNIVDIKAVSNIAKANNIWLTVDNTFASPYLQKPLNLEADIVMHSVTKYIGGHSDVLMGALICKDKELADRLYFIQNSSGAVSSPNDCFLVLRGIKTLHLRMQRHSENGREVAKFLNEHSKVKQVYWPGFEGHPNHGIAKKQMLDYGGMISFSLIDDSKSAAFKFMESLKIFSLAESLGGVESLVCHPVSMTHASIPKTERDKLGISDSLIRLSVGIEDINDLLADLEQALSIS